jgi:dihydrofolate reductase
MAQSNCRISLIAAMDRNRVIGRDNQIPWRLPAEMKWFKSATIGKPVVMGRKTYESIGRPLAGRHNIVLTRNLDYRAEGCTVVQSIEEAMKAAGPEQEIMVIGGAHIYEQFLPLAECLYLTFVEADTQGDTFFPDFDRFEWQSVYQETHPADEKNPYPYQIAIMQKVEKGNREVD